MLLRINTNRHLQLQTHHNLPLQGPYNHLLDHKYHMIHKCLMSISLQQYLLIYLHKSSNQLPGHMMRRFAYHQLGFLVQPIHQQHTYIQSFLKEDLQLQSVLRHHQGQTLAHIHHTIQMTGFLGEHIQMNQQAHNSYQH